MQHWPPHSGEALRAEFNPWGSGDKDDKTIGSTAPGYNTTDSRHDVLDGASLRSLKTAERRYRKSAAEAAMDGKIDRARQLSLLAEGIESELRKHTRGGASRPFRTTAGYRAIDSVAKQIRSAVRRIKEADPLAGQFIEERVLPPAKCATLFPGSKTGWMFVDDGDWFMADAWTATAVAKSCSAPLEEIEEIMDEIKEESCNGGIQGPANPAAKDASLPPNLSGVVSWHIRRMASPWMEKDGSAESGPEQARKVVAGLRRSAEQYRACGALRVALHREAVAARVEGALLGRRFGFGGGGINP